MVYISTLNNAAAIMMMNRNRGFGGGSNGGEPEKKKSRGLKNFLMFLISFSACCAISVFIYAISGWSHYTRPGELTNIHKGSHEYKGRMETDYFFIVQWLDQEKESEGFEVDLETFYGHKVGDKVYFSRRLPEAMWVDSWLGALCMLGGIAVFFISLMMLAIYEYE